MSNWSSGDVVANNIKIHYYRTGGDKPPLVLAHGLTDNGLCWTRTARALERDYDVIMFDSRGHGLSEAPETGYHAEQRAADLAGLVEALDLERPRLMGHSMGAETVAFAITHYSNLATCAVLEDPPWSASFGSAGPRQDAVADWKSRILARKAKAPEELLAAGREDHPLWADGELRPWAQAKQQVDLKALQMIAGLRANWHQIAADITCPTLLITADPAKGALVTPEVAAEVSALCPNLKVARIEGAGHNIRRERFEPYMDAVKAFLADAC
jgi:N-formylmaleamate deformylase